MVLKEYCSRSIMYASSNPPQTMTLLTDDKARLFVPVAMIDRSGTVEVRMREKAALELSCLTSKEEFIEESEQG